MSESPGPKPYEIALSFAGEDRGYVDEVARQLLDANVRCFYDKNEQVRLWGRDLAVDLQQVYFAQSDYVAMFISQKYVEKMWPGHEKAAALAAALFANREYILPVRFDDTPLPGINPTIYFVDARKVVPAQLTDMILLKIGRSPDLQKGNAVAPPSLSSEIGTADFNYQSHDGRFVIGVEPYRFETRWSPGPWIYNDPPSISGVAIASAQEIDEVFDASLNDFTSRARQVRPGNVVVLKNYRGYYAALKLIRVSGEANSARMIFDYVIKTDKGTSFADYKRLLWPSNQGDGDLSTEPA